MSTVPAALPPRIAATAFSIRQARFLGVTRARTFASDLLRPHHGVRSHSQPRNLQEAAETLAPVLADDQVFSHATAAVLLGLPLPRRLERSPLHVTTLGSDRHVRRSGVVGHRSRHGIDRLIHRQSLRIMHPVDIFFSLAPVLSVTELVVLGDAVIAERGGSGTLAELRHVLAERSGARGIRKARAALDLIRSGSRSPGETRLRLLLRASGLPEPSLNYNVTFAGQFIACVDLAFPQARLAIEYEGDVHRIDRATFLKDLTRGERLRDASWWLIRATAYDLDRGKEALLRRVRRSLARGPRGPLTEIVEAST